MAVERELKYALLRAVDYRRLRTLLGNPTDFQEQRNTFFTVEPAARMGGCALRLRQVNGKQFFLTVKSGTRIQGGVMTTDETERLLTPTEATAWKRWLKSPRPLL